MATATPAKPKTQKPPKSDKPKTAKASKGPAPSPAPKAAPSPKSVDLTGSDSRFKSAAEQLKTLGDPTRLQILTILDSGDSNVTDLCAKLGNSQPAVSHHLALLRAGQVVEATRDGKAMIYALTDKGRKLVEVARVFVD